GGGGRLVDLAADAGGDLVLPSLVEQTALRQHPREARDGVSLALPELDLLARAVAAVVVVAGVRRGAVGLGLEQRGALARQRALGGGARRQVDRLGVVAVDDHAGHAVAGRAVGDVLDRHLPGL